MSFKLNFIILTLTTFLLSVSCQPPVRQVEAVFLSSKLPTRRGSTAIFYDEPTTSIYILGGSLNLEGFDDVYRHNVNTDKTRRVGKFPHKMSSGRVGTNGNGVFYYFAGINSDIKNVDTTIYKFTPSNPRSVAVAVAELGEVRYFPGVASDGAGNIYLFGGNDRADSSHDILKYDTNTNSALSVYNLPKPFFETTATWVSYPLTPDRDSAYVFGGWDSKDAQTIYKYTPANPANKFEEMDAKIPSIEVNPSAALTVGEDIYILGALNVATNNYNIYQYDTNLDLISEILEVTNLNHELHSFGAAYVPFLNRIYVAGGYGAVSNYDIYDYIFYIDLN